MQAIYRKHFLPNYGVFDEHRYFAEGRDLLLVRLGEVYVAPTVCEDLWQPGPPATDLALAGAQLVVNLSASPFHVGKAEEREEMLVTRARDTSSYLAFCNLVGGQDELVFDGHSVVLDDAGEVVARAPGFEEHLLVVDVEPDLAIGRRLRDVRRRELDRSRETRPARRGRRARRSHAVTPRRARRRPARVRAGARADASCARPRAPRLRREERFRGGRVGVSGGIDSAVTAALCVDAFGAERVHCVSMPSQFLLGRTREPTHGGWPRASAAHFQEIPIEDDRRLVPRRAPRDRRRASQGWPRRTCRRGFAVCS